MVGTANLCGIGKRALAFSLICLGCLLFWGPVSALGRTQGQGSLTGLDSRTVVEGSSAPWNITADRITYSEEDKVYLAEGHVRIESSQRSMEADWAELNTRTKRAELRGNVFLAYEGDWLKGQHVMWNMEDETGWVDGGMAFFSANRFYVSGSRIARTSATEYELKDGFVTSCDPANSDWKIGYKTLNVNIDGMSWARGSSFLIKDVPILYLPVMGIPVQQQRQSGFLIPWTGYSSVSGAEVELPFYWSIRQDMDVTVYARYMEKRGWMGGLEYRIANSMWGDGVWMANYLRDYADRQDLQDKGFPYQATDRFWLRARHNFDLGHDIEGKLDLDLASDRYFLDEFDNGSSSFQYSNRLFRDLTGRGILNDETVLTRESALYLEKRFDSSLVSFDMRYWDRLDDPRIFHDGESYAMKDATLQRMPALSYSVIPSWIGTLPLYYTFESSSMSFWREMGSQGSRLDLHPRVYMPLHWGSFLDAEPSVGIRTTAYAVDWDRSYPMEGLNRSSDELQGRFLSDIRVDMSSRLNKVYPASLWDTTAVQHAIRPEFSYEYVPDPVEGDLPHFDRLDSNQARHDVRYGASTFFTARQHHTDSKGNESTTYLEFARFEVSQAYNIERMPQPVSDFGLILPAEPGFSDVSFRVDLTPRRYVTLSYDTDIAPETGEPTQQDIYMTLDSGKGHSVRVDYQYRMDTAIDEVITQFSVKLLPNVLVSTYHDYSLAQKDLFAQGYGLTYQSGCWAFGVVYEKEDQDQRVAFSVNLLGLGTLGSGFSYGTPGVGSPGRMLH